jgi:hypothetical protein
VRTRTSRVFAAGPDRAASKRACPSTRQGIRGRANISQTDTYLNAGRIALQDSIKTFEAERDKPVAKTKAIEERPVSHDEAQSTQKDLLH